MATIAWKVKNDEALKKFWKRATYHIHADFCCFILEEWETRDRCKLRLSPDFRTIIKVYNDEPPHLSEFYKQTRDVHGVEHGYSSRRPGLFYISPIGSRTLRENSEKLVAQIAKVCVVCVKLKFCRRKSFPRFFKKWRNEDDSTYVICFTTFDAPDSAFGWRETAVSIFMFMKRFSDFRAWKFSWNFYKRTTLKLKTSGYKTITFCKCQKNYPWITSLYLTLVMNLLGHDLYCWCEITLFLSASTKVFTFWMSESFKGINAGLFF